MIRTERFVQELIKAQQHHTHSPLDNKMAPLLYLVFQDKLKCSKCNYPATATTVGPYVTLINYIFQTQRCFMTYKVYKINVYCIRCISNLIIPHTFMRSIHRASVGCSVWQRRKLRADSGTCDMSVGLTSPFSKYINFYRVTFGRSMLAQLQKHVLVLNLLQCNSAVQAKVFQKICREISLLYLSFPLRYAQLNNVT